jgi:hypothetical protein
MDPGLLGSVLNPALGAYPVSDYRGRIIGPISLLEKLFKSVKLKNIKFSGIN